MQLCVVALNFSRDMPIKNESHDYPIAKIEEIYGRFEVAGR